MTDSTRARELLLACLSYIVFLRIHLTILFVLLRVFISGLVRKTVMNGQLNRVEDPWRLLKFLEIGLNPDEADGKIRTMHPDGTMVNRMIVNSRGIMDSRPIGTMCTELGHPSEKLEKPTRVHSPVFLLPPCPPKVCYSSSTSSVTNTHC